MDSRPSWKTDYFLRIPLIVCKPDDNEGIFLHPGIMCEIKDPAATFVVDNELWAKCSVAGIFATLKFEDLHPVEPSPPLLQFLKSGKNMRNKPTFLATDLLPYTKEGFRKQYEVAQQNAATCCKLYPSFELKGNIDLTNASHMQLNGMGPGLVFGEHLYPWQYYVDSDLKSREEKDIAKFEELRKFWLTCWKSLISQYSSSMVVMMFRPWEFYQVLLREGQNTLANLPEHSKIAINTTQHYDSQRMYVNSLDRSITTSKGGDCVVQSAR